MTAAAVTEIAAVRLFIDASNMLRFEMKMGRAIFDLSSSAAAGRDGISVETVHAFTAWYRPAMPNV